MKESKIEGYLVRKVRAAGGEIRKVRWIGRQGAPDRLVMWPSDMDNPPRLDWIELKAPHGTLRPAQIREHARMKDCGQKVRVLNTIDKIDQYLWEIGRD